ncbi:hypothetical protein BV20DRAFT_729972 [Pilatotrama ljubarskyi]|nr:hypothetical protein BV20DRAFT_729972 [Pilatotrama ljubarskyi]
MSLLSLNEDCLLQIFTLLCPDKGLQSLSLTCRWMRERCAPMLLERSHADAAKLGEAGYFPPDSLWPYIRCMTILGQFKPTGIKSLYGQPEHIRETRRREEVLAHSLCSMPLLHRIDIREDEERGIPWSVLSILLSTPSLREFSTLGRLFSQYERPPAAPHFSPAPITTFHYVPDYLRPFPRSSASENDVLALLLAQLSPSLRSLIIPSESAPFLQMNHYDWPQLQELCIQGDPERVWSCPVPLVSALSRMPRLRVLNLRLARWKDESPRPIWPMDHDMITTPWPELESLTISWPNAQDRVFDNLPATLSHLALGCWPRLYIIRGKRHALQKNRLPWAQGAPSWAAVLDTLRACAGRTALQSLYLEYSANSDVEDAELLRYMPTAFPHLQTLQIFRYSSPVGASPATVEGISEMMSCLHDLRVARFYLDFKYREFERRRVWGPPPGTHVDPKSIEAAAAVLLQNPGPSLERLSFLYRGGVWNVHHLHHTPDGRVEVRLTKETGFQDDEPYGSITDY